MAWMLHQGQPGADARQHVLVEEHLGMEPSHGI